MAKKRIIVYIWISCLVIAAIGFVLITWFHPQGILNKYWVVLPSLFTVSVFCEYIDSSLGMGYGTTLTPTLLILGVVRQEIVPVILLSEFLTGIFSAIAHTKEGKKDVLMTLRAGKDVSRKTLWENLDIDTEEEQKRLDEENMPQTSVSMSGGAGGSIDPNTTLPEGMQLQV